MNPETLSLKNYSNKSSILIIIFYSNLKKEKGKGREKEEEGERGEEIHLKVKSK